MAKVTIDGQEFTLNADKAQDLMQWLTQNGGVRVESTTASAFEGQQLLNETDQMKDRDPATPPKGDPKKDWDFGTPWI
jgi:D-serine dehydratase